MRPFPYILEMGAKKNGSIQPNTFPTTTTEGIRIYYIIEGRFEWHIAHQPYSFYPGDVALVLPGSPLGSDNGILEIGSFTWIHLRMQKACAAAPLLQNAKHAAALGHQMKQSEVRHVPAQNVRGATDGVGYGGVADLVALADQAHAER